MRGLSRSRRRHAAPSRDCTCEATGDTYCALQVIECVDNSECPDGLICVDGGSSAAPCFVDDQGNSDCPAVVPTAICAPPGYVTPLPLDDTGGVAAERASAAEGEGEGEGEDGSWCASTHGASGVPLALLFALRPLRRRRR